MDETVKKIIESIDYNMEKMDKGLDGVDNKFIEVARLYDAIKYDFEILKTYLKVTK